MGKIVKDITKPKEDIMWTLKERETIINDEKEIADIFNVVFKEKIACSLFKGPKL